MFRSILLATSLIAASATPAIANAEVEAISATVTARDLDLSNPTDRARLDRRIGIAIRRLCAQDGRDLSASAERQRCTTAALQSIGR